MNCSKVFAVENTHLVKAVAQKSSWLPTETALTSCRPPPPAAAAAGSEQRKAKDFGCV